MCPMIIFLIYLKFARVLRRLFLSVVSVTRVVYFLVNMTCFAAKHLKFDSYHSNQPQEPILIGPVNTNQVRCFKLLEIANLDARDFLCAVSGFGQFFILSGVPTFVFALLDVLSWCILKQWIVFFARSGQLLNQ